MAKVTFVKSARKENPVAKVGESYFWWKNFRGPKRFSKTKPTRAMLTTSEFLSQVFTIEDETIPALNSPEEVADIITELEELQSQVEDSRCNMPDHLQDVGSGELLQTRYDELQCWMDELETVAESYSDIDDLPEDQDKEPRLEEFRNEIQQCGYNGE